MQARHVRRRLHSYDSALVSSCLQSGTYPRCVKSQKALLEPRLRRAASESMAANCFTPPRQPHCLCGMHPASRAAAGLVRGRRCCAGNFKLKGAESRQPLKHARHNGCSGPADFRLVKPGLRVLAAWESPLPLDGVTRCRLQRVASGM